MKIDSAIDGGRAPYYRKAELWFESEAAMRKAMGMPEFAKIAADFPKFVTSGPTILLATHTNA